MKLGIQHHFASALSFSSFQSDCFSTSVVQVLHINCSGAIFQLPKRALCFIEGPVIPRSMLKSSIPQLVMLLASLASTCSGWPGSYLNHMFSDAYITSVPRDSQVPVRGFSFFFVDSESMYQQLKGACLPNVYDVQWISCCIFE